MKKKYFAFIVLLIAVFLNLIIPACGSKNNTTSTPFGAYSCIPGQACTGVNGTPMFPANITTSVDAYGSTAIMQLYASNYTAGQGNYSGNVTVQMQFNIVPGAYPSCPSGGSFLVSGTGVFQANIGGTYGTIQAQMQGTSGFQAMVNGPIMGGQDQFQSQPTQYYYRGTVANSCDPSAVGE